MTQSLDELKAKLYTAFDNAMDNVSFPTRPYIGTEAEQARVAAEALKSAAEIARAITGVEHEIAERDEKKSGMKLPGKG